VKYTYQKKEKAVGIVAIIGLLTVPAIVIKNRVRDIKIKEHEKNTIQKILKNTMELENNLTNINTIRYLQFIQSIDIPDKIMCKNVIIEGFKLVKDCEKISDKLKADLRILLECKGVSFIY
jgi:hypothetical protein